MEFAPATQNRLEAIETLLDRQDDSTALMSGILNALQGAIAENRGGAAEATPLVRPAVPSGGSARPGASPAVVVPAQVVPAASRAEPPGADVEETAVDLAPAVQSRLDAIEGLLDRQDDSTVLIGGILNALQEAIAESLDSVPKGPTQDTDLAPVSTPRPEGRLAADAPSPSTRQREVAHVRGLFPLIWELDAWREGFGARRAGLAGSAALCGDIVACVGTLREGLVRLLQAHNVEIIENFDTFDPGLHQVAAGHPGEPAEPAAGHVRRVGFLYRTGSAAEVLEPARVVLQRDMRKAG